jgi:hypothetical protein
LAIEAFDLSPRCESKITTSLTLPPNRRLCNNIFETTVA